jgi:hypothetical protein
VSLAVIVWTDLQGVRHWIDGETEWCNEHQHHVRREDRLPITLADGTLRWNEGVQIGRA